ncbi:DUF5615 family PIN-like protein [Brevundimonas variabilis]|uniref:DUF5615 family PIN-like protein n=1 Tax=Brevundimonas variabilis TaxID=74312 RepID=UPI001606A876
MTAKQKIRFFLDEGVTRAAARVFEDAGHEVIILQEAIVPGSPDPLVCAAAELNEAVLVAHDGDMRALASRRGVSNRRFRTLSLIKLDCRESKAPQRLKEAMSLIEHEWAVGNGPRDRRIFLVIGNEAMRTHR